MNRLIGPTVVVIALAAGFLAFSFSAKRHAEPPPASESTAPKPTEVPQRLPEIWLPDLTGQKQPLSKWTGQPLLINFWATWCEPCRREIPLLKALRAKHAAQKLEIIGIAMDFHDPVAEYVKTAQLNYPILLADQDGMVAQQFGVGMGLPFTVFADTTGHIIAVKTGELHEKEAEELLMRTLKAP